MAEGKPEQCCDKLDKSCGTCGKAEPPRYWCEVCEKVVREKRCPSCGLKARRIN